MHKLTRISFNSTGWHRPTGEAAGEEVQGTYNSANRFGHEDWLFRSEWLIDGWRYGFIQGVNKSHSNLVRMAEPFDLTLFTIHPDKTRRIVATIYDAECLTEKQALDAVEVFKARGWYATMLEEIAAVRGDPSALGDAQWAKFVLNVRFRLSNVRRHAGEATIPTGDWIHRFKRYQLYDLDLTDPAIADTFARLRGPGLLPSTTPYLRRGSAPCECTPEHARMQTKLVEELQADHPDATILVEDGFVDVSMRRDGRLTLFEIKSDLSPRVVIREALGQILEYAYHPSHRHDLPLSLVIAGRRPLTGNDKAYFDRIISDFQLPLSYRVVSI